MMPMFTMSSNFRNQQGASIVTAIFLITVLALLALGMVSVLTTSQQSTSQELTSARAYMAARSCLDWGMYQSVYDADPWTGSPYTLTFSNAGLANTGCQQTTITNITTDGLSFFTINTLGNYSVTSNPEYSERQLVLQFQP